MAYDQSTDDARTPSAEGHGFKRDLHQLGEDVGAVGADLRTVAETAVHAAKEKVTEAGDAAKGAAHSVKTLVGQHPMASVGIAAGVGLLVGLALFRSRS